MGRRSRLKAERRRINGKARAQAKAAWPFVCDFAALEARILAPSPEYDANPEYDARIDAYLKKNDEENKMLAAMTSEARAAWIAEWAKGFAAQEVQIGCAIDSALRDGDVGKAVGLGMSGFPVPQEENVGEAYELDSKGEIKPLGEKSKSYIGDKLKEHPSFSTPLAQPRLKKIYVASSWRNSYQPEAVKRLRAVGLDVYDYRNPKEGDNGFHWREVDGNYLNWTPSQMAKALQHPIAVAGFESDRKACEGADATVIVLPSGRSAHLELGVAVGLQQKTAIFCHEEVRQVEPELMYRWCSDFLVTWEQLEDWGRKVKGS